MNTIREINRINDKEIELGHVGGMGPSWHDDWKDTAYIYVGGLPNELTEGDVLIIFSQFGEIVDVHMPRDKETGKPRGFGFLMYEDQRSTILAVDNMNGGKVLGRTVRVDHTRYKQQQTKDEHGDWIDPDAPSMNAMPKIEGSDDDDSASDASDPDLADPMAAYLRAERKRERALTTTGGSSSKNDPKSKKGKDKESKEEKRARKAEKREKKARKEAEKMQKMFEEEYKREMGEEEEQDDRNGKKRGIGKTDRMERDSVRVKLEEGTSPRRDSRMEERSRSPVGRTSHGRREDSPPRRREERQDHREPPRRSSPRRREGSPAGQRDWHEARNATRRDYRDEDDDERDRRRGDYRAKHDADRVMRQMDKRSAAPDAESSRTESSRYERGGGVDDRRYPRDRDGR